MDALKQYHPAVGFSFFLLMIVLSLASMHPVFQVMSFIAAVGYSIKVSGLVPFLRGNWWFVFLILIVTLMNSLFGGRGLTVLVTLNLGFMQTSVTAEGLFYGFVMGLMLANVMLWFNVLGKVSSLQGFIELFSRFSPTAGMMIARITVFIPELLAQARMVDKAQRTFFQRDAAAMQARQQAHVQQLTSAEQMTPAEQITPAEQMVELIATDDAESASKRTRKGQLVYAGILSSHLMEWGMEKSLITANSMVARGYGSRKRTSYRRTRLTLRDLIPLVALVVLGLLSLVCVIWAGTEYQFYPYLSPLTFWWGYLPFLFLCLTPLILQLREELAWWQSS